MVLNPVKDIEACSTWLEIDLAAIRNNLKILETTAGCPVMPVVKANAYGHGLIEISQTAETAGVDWLGVARIEEAMALRTAGIKTQILVLGYTPPQRVTEAIQHNITLTIYDNQVARAYADEANNARGIVDVHIKVDSGMGRLGVFSGDALTFIHDVLHLKGIQMKGIFTHYARADEPHLPTTDEQIVRFNMLLEDLHTRSIDPGLVHAANSAGTINYPNGRYDMVRCGISFYGLKPSPETTLPKGVKPALSWKTHLTSVKLLPPRHGVSYNFHYTTSEDEKIGVIAIGYADGFRRHAENFALVRGKKVQVVGAVCMDQSMLQLDEVHDAEIGDEVVLIGTQKGATISAEDLAMSWGTITYEVICGLADRVPRFYLNQE